MEYEYNENEKRGHGLLALILALLSLAITIFVGVVFGFLGLIPAIILAVIAITLGVQAIRATGGRSGKGGLVMGIVAIIFIVLIGGMVLAIGVFLRSDEAKARSPILASYADESWKGIGGMIMKMNSDGVDFEKISDELNSVQNPDGAVVSIVETAAE